MALHWTRSGAGLFWIALLNACGNGSPLLESSRDAGDFDDAPVKVVGADGGTRRADAGWDDAGLVMRAGEFDAAIPDAPGSIADAGGSQEANTGTDAEVGTDASMASAVPDKADASTMATTGSSSVQDAQVSAPPPPPPSQSADAAAPDAVAPIVDASTREPVKPQFACTRGHYAGNFQGQVTIAGNLAFTVQGNVSFDLTANADGSQLALDNGSVTASDSDGVPVKATLTGYVDCATDKLVNGKLDGSYGADQATLLSFSGDVTGTYGDTPPALDGAWTAVASNGAQASGSFDSTLQD